MTQVKPFKIEISPGKIEEIKRRVTAFPWSTFQAPANDHHDNEWQYGPPPSYMRKLCQYWHDDYDWPQRQARMNIVSQATANVGDLDVHFVHERSQGSRGPPILLLHGWPYSFNSFHDMVLRLAHPENFGGKAEDGIDVVVPSMPGYAFSSAPAGVMGPKAIAALYDKLMVEVLGYDKYVAHGGDWGSYISDLLGFYHSDHCVGIHLTMLSVRQHGAARNVGELPADSTEEERAFAKHEARLWDPESGYSKLQSTRPVKLGYAMADSPIGVAAWIVEAFHAWSDLSHGRQFEEVYPFDTLLDEVMLYLVTDSFHSSTWVLLKYRGWGGRSSLWKSI